jgi:subtilisin family serine protease
MKPGLLLRPLAALLAVAACSRAQVAVAPAPEPASVVATAPGPSAPAPTPAPSAPPPERRPIAPAVIAQRLGLMPLASTGVPEFRRAHPTYDGRGVLIAILDSGIDADVLGLQTTTTGERKLLDLREFSGEGDVPLEPVTPSADGSVIVPGGLVLRGTDGLRTLAAGGPWYGGVLAERPFGPAPDADFNGNGTNADRFGVVVVRATGGWVAFVDANGDGSLADEAPVADFLVRGETFTFASRWAARGRGPITAALNLGDEGGRPRLAFVLDTSGHGTHVTGVAAGHDIYGLRGFDGVAPGARVIGLKIANNARGGVTTTGSMLRAMEYAARFAEDRHLPLVLNMSYGIGNENEGLAAMDSIADAFCLAHPNTLFVISAGNDGPGLSTMGLPGSAELAFTAGALYPGAFAVAQFDAPSPDLMGWWSSRGGELSKPDVIAPGVAYSTVPRWNTGEEIMLGTSFAAPHTAGLAALLVSAMAQEGRTVSAADLGGALRATASRLAGEAAVDQGAGVPNVSAAYDWLRAGHAAHRWRVQALAPVFHARGQVALQPSGGAAGRDVAASRAASRPTAAFRRSGLVSAADTVQRFRVSVVPDQAPARPLVFRLESDAPWLRSAEPAVTIDPVTGSAVVELRYDAARLSRAGRYVGTVRAIPAGDSSAGPAFVLANTIVVPDTVGPRGVSVTGRKLLPGSAARYYVAVPPDAAGLAARVVVRDTSAPGTLFLYEPSGRPARGREQDDFGHADGTTATVAVAAEDVVPGVYEAVVQALPGRDVTYDFQVLAPAVRIAALDSASATPSVTLAAARDTTLVVTADQIGVAASWTVDIPSGAVVTHALVVPAWASQLAVEVQLDREVWDQVTDFAITLFDRDGIRLANKAMNYALDRLSFTLPSKRAAELPVTLELFPGFARPDAPAHVAARVSVRFLSEPRALGFAGAQGQLSVHLVPGTTTDVRLAAGELRAGADGWAPLVRLRAGARRDDWAALVRTFTATASGN